MMFLVTVLIPSGRLVRRCFSQLRDAELFCDMCACDGLPIWEVTQVDTTISDHFCVGV
jgi:hypothetical protein